MRPRVIASVIGLEGVALLLAWLQSLGGVRTDEAKYLLNIPYPHPPLLRTIMSWTEDVPFQEMLWRVVLATLFVQAVWLIWDMGRTLRRDARIALCAAWLLSAGMLLNTGSIMLAPVNALQGLTFVWLLFRPELVKRFPVMVALWWTASLFTGYQAVLYLPVVAAVFLRAGFRWIDTFVYVCGPIGLLGIYTLSNPLSVASLVHHGGEQLAETWSYRAFHTVRLWLIGGSGVLSIVGTIGILRTRRIELIAGFALVLLFILLNWFEYYSILFTPLFIAGTCMAFMRWRIPSSVFAVAMGIGCVAFLRMFPLQISGSPARAVMQAVREAGASGPIFISGAFGHEWQYEGTAQIRRYGPPLLDSTSVIVCLQSCDGIPDEQWMIVESMPVPVYFRR
jgi:hypothetical protein